MKGIWIYGSHPGTLSIGEFLEQELSLRKQSLLNLMFWLQLLFLMIYFLSLAWPPGISFSTRVSSVFSEGIEFGFGHYSLIFGFGHYSLILDILISSFASPSNY